MATDPNQKTARENETPKFQGTEFIGITLGKAPPRICFRLKEGRNYIFPQYEFVSARLEPAAEKSLLFFEFRKYLVALHGNKLDRLARAVELDQVFAIEEAVWNSNSDSACYVSEIEIAEIDSQAQENQE